MADASDKRVVSVPYKVTSGDLADLKTTYGSMTARVGLLKKIFKAGGDLAAGCSGTFKTSSRKSHTRTRKIGGPSVTIGQTTYDVMTYPKKNVSLGKGGKEYKVLVDGQWWSFRVAGRQTDFHAYLCQNKAGLLMDVYYKTQNGASYYVNKTEEEN